MFPVRKINITTNINCLIAVEKNDNENKLLNFFLQRKKLSCRVKVGGY